MTIEAFLDVVKATGASYTWNPDTKTLSTGQSLLLSSLTSLPEGVTLSAGGHLSLATLRSLSEGVTLNIGIHLTLTCLLSLPESVTLTGGAKVLARSLQSYMGHPVQTKDSITTISDGSPHMIGGITVQPSRYFKALPSISEMPRCVVVSDGQYHAHGDTLREAMADLQFKKLNNTYPSELVKQIRTRGVVTFDEYQVLTGACQSGLREGLRSVGLDPETKELPLTDVIRLSAGHYGGERIQELFQEGCDHE